MKNHAVYPKLIILSYWNTPSVGHFFILSLRTTMIALRQVVSLDWLCQVMDDCVALMDAGNHIITVSVSEPHSL